MKIVKYALLIFFVCALGVAYATQKDMIACKNSELLGFVHIGSNIYIDKNLLKSAHTKWFNLVANARKRINDIYGPMTSNPVIVFTETEKQSQKFGSNRYGRTIQGPFGQCVVIGSKGRNIDVVAHELVHAEVHHRVGWFRHYTEIPIWFNEGVALQVDNREPYLIVNIDIAPGEIESIKLLDSIFFTSGNLVNNYKVAKLAVNGLEKKSFYENLDKIKSGSKFTNTFVSIGHLSSPQKEH
ncbi:hypothetical protein [Arenicella sp. 4NH20-0111]|uniref:hypothetical protein n=1 Tax=Arenicella sp. 4NH20-0111 TaxID=3127648 RepID=UPI003342CF3D